MVFELVLPALNQKDGHMESPEDSELNIVAVEEHVTFPSLLSLVSSNTHAWKVFAARSETQRVAYARTRSTAVGQARIADMDEAGIAVQILSLAGAVNSTHLPGEKGVQLAQDINNELKAAVDGKPTRYRAFAELPLHEPEAACQELRRAVMKLGFVGAMLSGSVGGEGKFLDLPEFDGVLSTFEELDVPLYLHPGVPPQDVFDRYYKLDDEPVKSAALGLAGWGWHSEVAIHVLRLVLSGTLDQHPRLKIIVGHLGEMMPGMMHRFDTVFCPSEAFGLTRRVGEIPRSQVWVAISGFFSLAPTKALLETWGADRVLFAVDYPFMEITEAQPYLRSLKSILSSEDFRKVCQLNAEKLLKFKAVR